MEKNLNKIVASLTLVLVSAFSMAETMVFDTVTSYKSSKGYSLSTIAGIEKDTGNSISASFSGSRDTGDTVSGICTPSVLTAMEKPGRYYLHVSWDENNYYDHVQYCMLELKDIPQ